MTLNFKIVLILTSYFLSACEKTVTTYKPVTPRLQVISAIQCIDSVGECVITKTNELNDISLHYITGAAVYLYRDGIMADTLKSQGDTCYRGKIPLHGGANYSVRSKAEGYPDASCEFRFPETVDFEITSYKFGPSYNEWTGTIDDNRLNVIISISDPPGENFYSLRGGAGYIRFVDTLALYLGNGLISSKSSVIQSECLNNRNYNERVFYFSDQTFENTKFSTDFDCWLGFIDPGNTQFVFATVMCISKDYYNFLKTFCNQENAQAYSDQGFNLIYNIYPYAEVYSNIKGGTGIWACYSYSTRKMIVKP